MDNPLPLTAPLPRTPGTLPLSKNPTLPLHHYPYNERRMGQEWR